ncbi:MAG: PhnD/SsuA/transferrin family substrate-binding protein [Anaerolineaceae bacterium]|nr:PhnD/SsuA/transferrin family substrate-binding protein [Anaerolineaceae bacterium]
MQVRPYFTLTALLLTALLTSCTLLPARSPAATPSSLPIPTIARATPEPKPLGDPENPLIQAIVTSEGVPGLTEAGQTLSEMLQAVSGYAFQTRFFTDYPALLAEMEMGKLHLAWLPPLTHIYAQEEGFAQLLFLTNHFGVFQYGFQFLANADSGFYAYYDPALGVNTADATTALQQFAGRQPCYVDLTSPSGYILPAGILAKNEVSLLPGAILQNHTSIIRALYIKDICDFGVTFAVSGDPRTAANLQDLPDVTDRIQIIWRSEGIIPNTSLSILPEIPEEMQAVLAKSYLDISKSEDGLKLLSTALQYDVQGLKMFDDSVYIPLQDALESLKIAPETLIGK